MKRLECCDNQRMMVDESFSYATLYDLETGLYIIDTNDYATLGFENPQCINCGTTWDIDQLSYESC